MKFSHLLSLITVATLTACGNLSEVADDGSSDNLKWPQIDQSTFNHSGSQFGSWPNWDNVRMVERGMNKDQLYNLLGRPHFAEGLYGVREWDYVFNYRENGQHKVCQYKVLFDKNMNAQNFFWYPNGCNGNSAFSLSGDLLFNSDQDTLTAKAEETINNVANVLKSSKAKEVTIEGYADSVGNEKANMELSLRRAERVKARLIEKGVEATFHIVALGQQKAVESCAKETGKALNDCLKNNRRVQIKAAGTTVRQQTKGGSTGPVPYYRAN